jgi:hypothetical protein
MTQHTDLAARRVRTRGVFVVIITTLLGGLLFVTAVVAGAVIPILAALGVGAALTATTELPFAVSVALALGSFLVAVLVYYARSILGELREIRFLLDDMTDSDPEDS